MYSADTTLASTKKIRQLSQARANKAKDRNISYKNTTRVDKTFRLGMIVAHRELQLATSKANSMNPKFRGPYIIIGLDPDGCQTDVQPPSNTCTTTDK